MSKYPYLVANGKKVSHAFNVVVSKSKSIDCKTSLQAVKALTASGWNLNVINPDGLNISYNSRCSVSKRRLMAFKGKVSKMSLASRKELGIEPSGTGSPSHSKPRKGLGKVLFKFKEKFAQYGVLRAESSFIGDPICEIKNNQTCVIKVRSGSVYAEFLYFMDDGELRFRWNDEFEDAVTSLKFRHEGRKNFSLTFDPNKEVSIECQYRGIIHSDQWGT